MTLPSIDAMRGSALILHVEDDPIDVGNLRRAFSRCGIANPVRAVPSAAGALTLLPDGPEDALCEIP